MRLLLEERASFSPDGLTGMEANLRFAGPETMETKIFARLTAWQNWIFQRPNAVGPEGALTRYGSRAEAEFRFEEGVSHEHARHQRRLLHHDPEQCRAHRRPPRAQGAGGLAPRLHRLVARHGAGGLPGVAGLSAHRLLGRSARLGQVRLRADAGISLGHSARPAGREPQDSVRRAATASRPGRTCRASIARCCAA